MYKIKITERKNGLFCEYTVKEVSEINPTAMGHGLPERIVNKDSGYDLEDVLEEIPAITETKTRMVEQVDEFGNVTEVEETYEDIIEPAKVRLRSEFSIEVEDITAQVEQQKVNSEALKFLADTDWMVLRHRDQLAANITTSLSYSEYEKLLHDRQQARDAIVH
jgi:hypothetical protein